jgi:hypothetical protein
MAFLTTKPFASVARPTPARTLAPVAPTTLRSVVVRSDLGREADRAGRDVERGVNRAGDKVSRPHPRHVPRANPHAFSSCTHDEIVPLGGGLGITPPPHPHNLLHLPRSRTPPATPSAGPRRLATGCPTPVRWLVGDA